MVTFDRELAKRRIEIEAHIVNCKDASCICNVAISLIEIRETIYKYTPPFIDTGIQNKMNILLPSCKDWPTIWDRLRHACDAVNNDTDAQITGQRMLNQATRESAIIFENTINQED
tara:strand:- start:289 stop:636 length:348 start_codon:yes stop_codon:yes gene_type:complete